MSSLVPHTFAPFISKGSLLFGNIRGIAITIGGGDNALQKTRRRTCQRFRSGGQSPGTRLSARSSSAKRDRGERNRIET